MLFIQKKFLKFKFSNNKKIERITGKLEFFKKYNKTETIMKT